MTRTILLTALFTLALEGCGGPQERADAPSRGPDVLIPRVSEEQSKKGHEDTPAPVGTRSSSSPASPGWDGSEPGSSEDPWSSYGTSQRGGPDCDRAAECCLRFYAASGADPTVQSTCYAHRIAPSTLCAMYLSSFQQLALSTGVQCH